MVVAATCQGQALVQPSRTRHVARLFTGLGHAAADDLAERERIDAGALEDAGLNATEQGGGVQIAEVSVALTDGRTSGLDDDGIAHGVSCLLGKGRGISRGG